MDTTTIEIRNDQWSKLNGLKEEPGESFKDVLDRLTAVYEEVEAEEIELDALTDDDEQDPDEIAREHHTFEEIDRDAGEIDQGQGESDPLPEEQRDALNDALDERMEWMLVQDEDEERARQRIDAARAAVEYIAREGGAKKKEIVDAVEPEHPVDDQKPDTWYRKNVRPILNEVAEYNASTRQQELM